MKFGTDTGEYGKINGSINIILNFIICFHFQVMPWHFEAFDDYIILHNFSMLLTYMIVVIVSLNPH